MNCLVPSTTVYCCHYTQNSNAALALLRLHHADLLYRYKKWVSLTDHISPQLLDQLMPLGGKIFAATPLQSEPSTTQSRRAAAIASSTRELMSTSHDADNRPRHMSASHRGDIDSDSRLPQMEPLPGSQIRFSVIPWTARLGTSPAEVTSHGMDRTATLDSLLASYSAAVSGDAGVLGELQFAFVCFIIGQVGECVSVHVSFIDVSACTYFTVSKSFDVTL